MDIIRKTIKEIKGIKKVQGATKVARAVIFALENYGKEIKEKKLGNFFKKMEKAATELLSVRKTEPLAQNAARFIFSKLKNAADLNEAKKELNFFSKHFLEIIEKADEKIIKNAAGIVKNNDKIFTHCHSSLVEFSLKEAKREGKNFEVFNTETRPLFQGRITARKLLEAKISVTMIVDSLSADLVFGRLGKEAAIDKIFIGADAILADGSIINKVGSFGISLAAKKKKIPLYIIASLLKFFPKDEIEIEKRPAEEVWKNKPKELIIINPAFDKVPAEFISGIICEAGIIKPKEAKKKAKALYPWIS